MTFLLPGHQVKEGTAEDPANDLSFSSRKDLSEHRHSLFCAVLPPASRFAFMPVKSKAAAPKDSSANLGFEAKLWLTADKLRNSMTRRSREKRDRLCQALPEG